MLALACALVSPAYSQTTAQQVAALLKQGQTAENVGDPKAAQQAYASALKLDPNNAAARYSLGQVRVNAASLTTKGREAKFGNVMVPLFQLDGASLAESLDALRNIVEKQSKEEVTPNFIVKDPKGILTDKKISMNVKNMPSRGVMKYLLEQVDARVVYEEHAIVISPR